MTEDASPNGESVPNDSKISQSSAVEPLPEIDFNRLRGKSSEGNPRYPSKGESAADKASIIPETRKSFTAKFKPSIDGIIP